MRAAGRDPAVMRVFRIVWLAACAGSLVGCGHLLPTEKSDARSSFQSFEAAQQALERVVPFQTTVEELSALGFDVRANANVTLIPYPALIALLAPNESVPLDALDPGIRECILSRMACRTYRFDIGRQFRRREGGFWADFLNFKRRTEVSGWRFEALVAVRGDVVLFRNFGGEPRIARTELRRNPLGPLQPAGEASGGLIIK
jgi:hypothetical protein